MDTSLKDAIGYAEYGLVKYVRVGEEIRFGNPDSRSHKGLANGDEATSAGFIYFDLEGEKYFRVTEEWSMTLSLGPDPADHDLIKPLWEEFNSSLKER